MHWNPETNATLKKILEKQVWQTYLSTSRQTEVSPWLCQISRQIGTRVCPYISPLWLIAIAAATGLSLEESILGSPRSLSCDSVY